MNDASLEEMGEEVRRVIGEQPDEARRRRQRAAVAMLQPGRKGGRRLWLLAGPAVAAAAAAAWILQPSDQRDVEAEPAAVVQAEQPVEAIAEEWIKAPKGGSAEIDLGPYARGTLHASGNLRVTERTQTGARLLLETGRLDLRVEHGQNHDWVVVAGPYEIRALGTELTVDWFAVGEDLLVEVTRGEVAVSGAHLGEQAMVVSAGKVLEANLRAESVTVRGKKEVDLELNPPRFEGRIPDVEQDPLLARMWADYYLKAHPDGDQIEVARELFLRSFAKDRKNPDAKTAAKAYLQAHPRGSHAGLAHEILDAIVEPD